MNSAWHKAQNFPFSFSSFRNCTASGSTWAAMRHALPPHYSSKYHRWTSPVITEYYWSLYYYYYEVCTLSNSANGCSKKWRPFSYLKNWAPVTFMLKKYPQLPKRASACTCRMCRQPSVAHALLTPNDDWQKFSSPLVPSKVIWLIQNGNTSSAICETILIVNLPDCSDPHSKSLKSQPGLKHT